ncbi:MAG: hypothetical protein ACR2K5_02455 [Pseudolabrys sp.]
MLQAAQIALIFIFLCSLAVFAWAKRGVPKNVDEWIANSWMLNPSVFSTGIEAINKSRPKIVVASFLVCGVDMLALIILSSLVR